MTRPLASLLALAVLLPTAARAWPDCGADAVSKFNRIAPAAYGKPAQALDLPDQSAITEGALDVVALGTGGSITLAFVNNVIVDGPGPDFIVFENAFFCLPPDDASDDYGVFAEPVIVEVSDDGVNWARHPYDAASLAALGGTGCADRAAIEKLVGLAGITPTYGGINIVPDDLLVWDAAGTAGVSGWGGDAFDLSDFGLTTARFIRLTDAGTNVGFPGATQGADIDAVVALHSVPAGAGGTDTDGDGLSDREEKNWGTDPELADTDGDGMDDGTEAASCHCPLLAGDTTGGINVALMLEDADHDGRSDCYPKKVVSDDGGSGGGGGGCAVGSAGAPARSLAVALVLPLTAALAWRRWSRRRVS